MIRVIHAVSIMDRAGQETFLMNVYRRLNRDAIQFDFQCSRLGKGDYDEEIHQLGGKTIYLGENKIKLPWIRYIGDVVLQYKFFKSHRNYEAYHIHTYHAFNAWLSIVGAKMAGMKNVILHCHSTKGQHPILHRIFRFMLRGMNIKRYACSAKAGVWMFGEKVTKAGKVKIIFNGIEPENFSFDQKKREEKREELKLKNDFVIGHIGNFSPPKNYDFLIDIFYQLNTVIDNAKLLLIGSGGLEDTIRAKVEKLNMQDKVLFLGVRTDINELLWAMDVFLFPSLYEGLSVSAIEAQASGVSALVADTLVKETKITECFWFMSLQKEAKEWATKLLELQGMGHVLTTDEIRKAGYDIGDSVKFLEVEYTSKFEKSENLYTRLKRGLLHG